MAFTLHHTLATAADAAVPEIAKHNRKAAVQTNQKQKKRCRRFLRLLHRVAIRFSGCFFGQNGAADPVIFQNNRIVFRIAITVNNCQRGWNLSGLDILGLYQNRFHKKQIRIHGLFFPDGENSFDHIPAGTAVNAPVFPTVIKEMAFLCLCKVGTVPPFCRKNTITNFVGRKNKPILQTGNDKTGSRGIFKNSVHQCDLLSAFRYTRG